MHYPENRISICNAVENAMQMAIQDAMFEEYD